MCHKLCSRWSGDDSQQFVARHIKLLHHYNETKDAAQVRLPYFMSAITNTLLSTDNNREGAWFVCAMC